MSANLSTTAVRPRPVAPRSASALPALGLILVVQLMVVLDTTVVNVALPDLQRALSFSTPALSWVMSAYTLAFGGLLLLGSRAGDLLGRRQVLMAGLGLFTVASLAGGLAPSAGLLLAARGAQGVGAALAAPQALSLLTTSFPEGRLRNRALGWFTAVSIGGAAIGLLLGGMLTDWVSWRGVFFINVPIGLAVLALAPRYLTRSARAQGHFDLAGAATATIGMTSLVFGFVRVATHGWLDPETLTALALGALLLTAFVQVERRAAQPIIPMSLLLHRHRSAAYIAGLLVFAGMLGTFFFLTQFLQEIVGLTPLQTGLAFLPLTAAVFTASQLSSRVLVNRFGPRTVVIVGLSLSTAAMLLLTGITPQTGYPSLLAPLILFGLGNGTAFPAVLGLALTDVPREHAGAASGVINTMQQTGGSLGLAILVTIFGDTVAASVHSQLATRQQVFTHGASAVFLAAAVFLVLTITVVVLLARGSRPAVMAQR